MLTALVMTAVIAVVAVTAGGSSTPPKPDSDQANRAEHAINVLLAGIPQRADILGQPTAPITLRWYGDLECPYCKMFTLGALPSIIDDWVRNGRLKIEYLSMETATRGRKVFQAQQVAALAAGMQDKMWNYIETFYHEQGEEDTGYATKRYLRGLATQIPGLNITLWADDLYDPSLATEVETERKAARHAHYRGTPTFLIGRSNGAMHLFKLVSLTSAQHFNEAIENLS